MLAYAASETDGFELIDLLCIGVMVDFPGAKLV
jgi:hypothetical protein